MIRQGKINPLWNKNDFVNLSYENVTYGKQVIVDDPRDFDRYTIGMGYFRDQSLESTFNLTEHFSHLKNKTFAIHKISSGYVLPFHSDLFSKYKEIFSITDIDQIERIIVFLEDWKDGHILQVGKILLSNWEIGSWISWNGKELHMAANLGREDRYTLQITGHY